jgi:hypothetical protein
MTNQLARLDRINARYADEFSTGNKEALNNIIMSSGCLYSGLYKLWSG